MESRMKSPAMTVPGAMEALQALGKAVAKGGVPRATLELVNLRASQINGCAVCLDLHSRALKTLGEKDERIFALAGGPVLLGRRARSAGPNRGGDAHQRSRRPGAGRDLERGTAALQGA